MAILFEPSEGLDVLQHRLQLWLRSRPNAAAVTIVALRQASDANGYSNETYRVDLDRGGTPQRLILRLPPTLGGLLPSYDLARQYAFLAGLVGEAPGLRMAHCYWLETDPAPLGRPFFLVEYVDGLVAPDRPPYTTNGWVFEATADERRRLWYGAIDQLAHLSTVRWQGTKLDAVDWPDRSRPRLAQHLDWYADLTRWGHQQLPAPSDPIVDELLDWLRRNMPTDEEPGIVWGDARFGNMIVRDFTPVALLDWELAVIGDPEIDISYMLLHHLLREVTTPAGAAATTRLDGFPDDETTVAYYAEAAGRAPRHYRYYWLFNAYRLYSVLECLAPLLVRSGDISEEEAVEKRRLAALTPYVAEVLGSATGDAYVGGRRRLDR